VVKKSIVLLLSATFVLISAQMAVSQTQHCFIYEDLNGKECFYLEAVWHGVNDKCPETETNPAFNWCMARVARDEDGYCCRSDDLKPNDYTECYWAGHFNRGGMPTCMNTCIWDYEDRTCLAKYLYNGECSSNVNACNP
jgi:hypothetical protein